MKEGSLYDRMLSAHAHREPLLFLLIDPAKVNGSDLTRFAGVAASAGVDGFLVGGSLTFAPHLDETIAHIKAGSDKPVVLFPGGVHQISGAADAILFLSLVSGRNPDQLIGQHVIAAPIIKRLGLESIATAYMIVESGEVTSTEYMSYSKPLPRTRPDIAVAHALAAEMLGMKLLYLEAGSGARQTVPNEMIAAVRSAVSIPLIVGGGIRTPGIASEKVRAGASIVVIGNHFENENNWREISVFVEAVKSAHRTSITEV